MADPWFKFYPSDWLAGTRGLSPAEVGIYITMIAMMYEREGPIEMDRKRLARLCACHGRTFNAALQTLIDDDKIVEAPSGFSSKRVEKELLKKFKKSECNSKAANTRWEKEQQNQRSDDANASETQCEKHAILEARSQTPDKKTPTESKKKPEQKASKPKAEASPLPSEYPDSDAKARAVAFWQDAGLAELVPHVDFIAARFRDYHLDAETVSTAWGRNWSTWYRRAKASDVAGREAPKRGRFDDPPASISDVFGVSRHWIRRVSAWRARKDFSANYHRDGYRDYFGGHLGECEQWPPEAVAWFEAAWRAHTHAELIHNEPEWHLAAVQAGTLPEWPLPGLGLDVEPIHAH